MEKCDSAPPAKTADGGAIQARHVVTSSRRYFGSTLQSYEESKAKASANARARTQRKRQAAILDELGQIFREYEIRCRAKANASVRHARTWMFHHNHSKTADAHALERRGYTYGGVTRGGSKFFDEPRDPVED